jgi:hypothetical protein
MASVHECRAALEILAARLSEIDQEVRNKHAVDRTLSCKLRDLDVIFSGRLHSGEIVDITTDPQPKAQLRFTMTSDDLIALTHGRLHLATAWARGQVNIEAGIRDLLRLRSLL